MRFPLAIAGSLLLVPTVLAAQNVQGKVFDTYTRGPLSGVSVSSGASATTVSGQDGSFSLPCTPNMTVDFRVLGYSAHKAQVANCADALLVGLASSTQNLNAVNVVGTRDGLSVSQPLSATTLSRTELDRGPGVFLDDALNAIPGVRMERRTMSGGQRITIRGYGNRTNFDGSGFKALLNGVPITDAEGVTMMDDIDFATLGQVDVIRGPASSLYGAGIAGVVNLYTMRPTRAGTSFEQEIMSGADGLLRSDTRIGTVGNNSTLLVNYGHQGYDSYRVQSASTKDHAMFLGDFRPSARRTISAFLTYANSYDERAGQLDSASFFNKKNVGETPYINNDGHNRMESVRVGVTHSYKINEKFENVVTGYFSGVAREDVFAVGINPRSNQTFGARAVVNSRFMPSGRPITGVTGFDFEQTNQFAKGYPLTNKVQGGITTDLETRTMQYSAFSQWDISLPASFMLTAGASLNFIEYSLADRLTNTANPTHRDLTGRKTYDPVVMPRVSLLRMFGNNQSVYASFSQGFTPATSSDAVIPFTGEPNVGLKPERANQIEVGTKGSLLDQRLSYQLALFQLKVSDKLTSQSVFNSAGTQLYAYTVNAGDQVNNGAELTVSYSALRAPVGVLASFRPFLSYAYSDFKYDNFKNNNNNNAGTINYDGKAVVGVPKNVYTVGADVSFLGGVYANGTAEHRDAMPLTYDNVHSAPAYTLINARGGIRHALGSHLDADAFVGAQNITSELYYTMAFLNGNYSAASPAVFLPGPYTSKVYGGLKVSIHP